jgi:proline iminopeptidase
MHALLPEILQPARLPDGAFRPAYIRNDVWLNDGILIENASKISHVPGILVNGRFDFQAPVSNAWELKRAWPRAEMVIVDDAGHGTPEIGRALVRAADHFAPAGSR